VLPLTTAAPTALGASTLVRHGDQPLPIDGRPAGFASAIDAFRHAPQRQCRVGDALARCFDLRRERAGILSASSHRVFGQSAGVGGKYVFQPVAEQVHRLLHRVRHDPSSSCGGA
jgi:hypothetical protein